MNRRAFLSLAAVSPSAAALARVQQKGRGLACDLAIIGGGVGGCSAALAAASRGLNVVMAEPTDWIGGQLTSQAVPPDEHPWIEETGSSASYRRFRALVRQFYRDHTPLTAAAKADAKLNPGLGSVSRLCHDPRAALAALYQMLAPHIAAGRVRILLNHAATAADVAGDRVRAVTLTGPGGAVTVTAPYFLDATELGDLLPMAGCEFVTGAEGQAEFGEPHAPAAAQPLNQQAFTWCFALEHRPGEDHTIPKPADYAFWQGYVPKMTPAWPGKLLSWDASQYNAPTKTRRMGFDPTGPGPKGELNLWTYRRILAAQSFAADSGVRDVCLVNWPQNDYWLGPLVGVPAADAGKHLARGVGLSLSLLYWMQSAAPRPDGGTGWPGLKLRDDLLGTTTGVAMAPYIRESRRARCEVTVTENHIGTDARAKALGQKPGTFAAEQFADSVGVGSYRIDLHPSSGGDNYVDVSSLPFQIPLGALIPKRLENLIPACKNLGVTHITNGCFRLHPVEWGIGEAAGHLVAHALASKLPPRAVRANRVADLQRELTAAGVDLAWPEKLRTAAR